MILARLTQRLRDQDWFAVILELMIVIGGIFIGLQANAWNDARLARAEERGYLQRLLDDNLKNIQVLEGRVARQQDLVHNFTLAIARFDGKPVTENEIDGVHDAVCRWNVPPALPLERGTYDELLSAGRVGLLRNTDLRNALDKVATTHDEVRDQYRLFGDKLLNLGDRLEPAREWRPVADFREHRCIIDWDRMRTLPGARSALAQLYFASAFFVRDHQSELEAEKQLRTLLLNELGMEARTE